MAFPNVPAIVPQGSTPQSSRWYRSSIPSLLLGVLTVALLVRLPQLGLCGYEPDEIWGIELVMGHGSTHLNLPPNVAMPPPVIFDLSRAAAWWHLWTTLSLTSHPPLYHLLLRGWVDLFGLGDVSERMFSVIADVLAVAALFDLVRMVNGTWPAVWAALLMAIAEPQIFHARLTRNYGLLMLVTLALANALVSIEKRGTNRWRLFALGALALATMLTHYFCIGTLAALFSYGMIRMRGRQRKLVAGTFVAAGVVYLCTWGPFLWQQRHLFSTADEGMLWLAEPAPDHLAWTLQRFLLVPAEMLIGEIRAPWVWIGIAGTLLVLVPAYVSRCRPDVLLWTLWLVATPGFILALDLAHETSHLHYLRYTLLTGPAVYALIASVSAGGGSTWGKVNLAVTLLASAVAIQRAVEPFDPVDPHVIQRQFQPLVQADDMFLFVATGKMGWACGENYLLVSRYFKPQPALVAFLDRPASPDLMREVHRRSHLLVFTKTEDARLFVPGMVVQNVVDCPGRGMIWTMTPPAVSAATRP